MTNDEMEKVLSNFPDSFAVKVKSVFEFLKNAERKGCTYLLNWPDAIFKYSITDIARSADCSTSTLVHFARKLGYESYRDMKLNLIREMSRAPNYNPYEAISEHDNARDIAAKVIGSSIKSLESTLNNLDAKPLEKATEYLLGAKKMLFVGAGDSFLVAFSGGYKFSRAGYYSVAYEALDSQLVFLSSMENEDVLVVVSHSGKTKSLIEVIKLANGRGIRVITIGNYPSSPIAKRSDVMLSTAAFDPFIHGESISKRVTEFCIMDTLFMCVYQKHKKQIDAKWDKSQKILMLNKLS
ncbi:MAG: MurR/RpiR family transcriptional regulator [Synergistaceae bacterium]|jgi:DNA-binding MurR/RpiR family transcriptional regulator|nr:MurR/RpiR family transcriptional regulator [Synergistaceae bacterium]